MREPARAIRFGARWCCQVCGQTAPTEYEIWRHLVEAHQPHGMPAWLEGLVARYQHTVSSDGHTHTYRPRETP